MNDKWAGDGLAESERIETLQSRIEALEAALREIMNDECLDPWSKAKQALEGE